jgi:hypothetical protein
MPGMSGDGRPGAATATNETPNGLVKNRYLDVRDQVRWMPIGMDLIVDQGNMQDVLTAVANSRLGIQTTQVSWSHVHGIRPSTAEGGGEGGREGVGPRSPGGPGGDTAGPPSPPAGGYGQGSPRPGAGGPGMAGPPPGVGYGQGSPRPGGGSGGPRQPFNPGDYAGFPGLGGSGASSSDPEDANLVELSIYGIAALYERFPPKPSSAADASKAPKP